MNNFKINAERLNFGTGNTIEINLEDLPILKDIKIVDAVLSVKLSSEATNGEHFVHYKPIPLSDDHCGWENIDKVFASANQILKINISDELQDAFDNNSTKIQLIFDGSNTITFANDTENDFLNIDYISLSEYQSNGSSHNIDLGKSGNASIDLVTGKLSVSTPVVNSDNNVLPLSIVANYHSVKNPKMPEIGMPDNWSLNVNQFLLKEADASGSLKFTYIDKNGKNQIIEEKYSYINTNGDKKYALRKDKFDDSSTEETIVTVDLDGNYVAKEKTTAEDGTILYNEYPITTELVAPSGIKLVSSIENVPGYKKVNFEPEELIEVKTQIKQLNENIQNINDAIAVNNKQFCISALNRFSLIEQLKAQQKNINDTYKHLEIQELIEKLKQDAVRQNRYYRITTNDGFSDEEKEDKPYYTQTDIKSVVESLGNNIFTKETIDELLSHYPIDDIGPTTNFLIDTAVNVPSTGGSGIPEATPAVDTSTSPTIEATPGVDNDDDEIAAIEEWEDYVVKGTLLANESSTLYSLGLKNEAGETVLKGSIDKQLETNDLNYSLYNYAISSTMFNSIILQAIEKFKNLDGVTQLKESSNELYNMLLYKLGSGTEEYPYNENIITIAYKDLLSIDLQIENAINSYCQYTKTRDEYIEQLCKYEHQLKLLEMQVPIHYLYDANNIVYGFGKTFDQNNKELDVYRLILITDAYENLITINYQSETSHKIDNIVDSTNRIIAFTYSDESGLIKEVVDARDRKTCFEIFDSKLTHIDRISGHTSFQYDSNGEYLSIRDHSGVGVKFILNKSNKVLRVDQLSTIKSVSNKNVEYLTNTDNDVVADNYIIFDYLNYKSTSLTNAHGKIITYLFNKYGNVSTIYENKYNPNKDENNLIDDNSMCDDDIIVSSFVKQFDYKDKKVSLSISKYPYSIDYLETATYDESKVQQVCQQSTSTKYDNLYLGDELICSSTNIPSDYIILHNHYTFKDGFSSVNMSVNDELIKKILSEHCHKLLILSAWAKAENSAFIITDENTIDYPTYDITRKFEIRAEIKYSHKSDVISFSKSFDWRNTDWQYCALPIFIEDLPTDSTIESFNCYIDYSNNIGEIEFTNLELKLGDFEKTEYNSDMLPIKIEQGHSDWIKTFTYNNNKQLTKETILRKVVKENVQNIFEKHYFYNKTGKCIKTIDFNGIVTESVLNNKGSIVKTLIYNKNEPSNVFCQETSLNEKGETIGEVNEFGEKLVDYTYKDGTNIIEHQIDMNDVKTSYGYSEDDTLIESTITIDGENNTNTYGYTLDHLTGLRHNNFEINFDYDNLHRCNKISIDETTYLTREFDENDKNIEFVTLGTNETYKKVLNNDGKLLQLYYIPSNSSDEIMLIQNIYDVFGNLIYCENKEDNTFYKFYIDQFGNTYKEESLQHNNTVTISNEYDSNHKNIETSIIEIKNENEITPLQYDYIYSDSPTSELLSIMLPNKETQHIEYDKLGRISKFVINNIVKEFTYLKNGNRTSNLISKLNYSNGTLINDVLSYKYDHNGNIIEIRKSNELVARYKYDSLSRIIREDNKLLNKTQTYEYDGGGNITIHKEYAYTLSDNLNYEEYKSFKYSYPILGWRDQLQAYNGQIFTYDNIGNPTKYRDIDLTWSHGRQLDKYGDIASYFYNSNGIRTTKIANGFTTNFYLSGNKIIRQRDASNDIIFYYGANGVTGFHITSNNATYNNEPLNHDFYYKKNVQNDIIGIYDYNGKEIIQYVYDAWGNHIAINTETLEPLDIHTPSKYTNTSDIVNFIATKNPFRYRSYYYDFETGFYYLNSRYYDPELGRFINADDLSYLDPNHFNGLNLYTYCINNPINLSDENGNAWWDWIWKGIVGALVVVAVTAAVVITAGTAAVALGASIGTAVGVMSGAAVGGLVAGGVSLVGQAVTVGLDNLNFGTLAIDTFSGAAYGGITGGISSIGTIGAQIIGGVSKVALNGLTTMMHGFNDGLSANETFTNVGKSMLTSLIIQSTIIGGGQLAKFMHFGTVAKSNNSIINFIKNSIDFIKDNTNFRIAMVQLFVGVLNIFKRLYK